MRNLLTLFLALPLLLAAQQYPENDRQLQFARDVFSRIALKDYDVASDRYIAEKDLDDLIRHTDQAKEKEEMILMLEKYQTLESAKKATEMYQKDKQRFVRDFPKSLDSDAIAWKNAHIDSIQYAYEIIYPNGKNPDIPWPISRDYELTGADVICCRTTISFNDGKHTYMMSLESLYYNKQWWFFHTVRTPRVILLK